jgi:hypothetical protein
MSVCDVVDYATVVTKGQLFSALIESNHVQNMVHKRLQEHVAVENNPELKAAADKAAKALSEFHQLASTIHYNMR